MSISPALRELAAAAALSALLFASGILVPVIGPGVGFFASAPLMVVTVRQGARTGVLAALLAASALLAARVPPPAALIYLLEHAVPGTILGMRLARGGGVFRNSVAVAVLVTSVLLLIALLWLRPAGADPAAMFDRELRASLESLGAGSGQPAGDGALPGGLPAEILPLLNFLRRAFPALALIGIFLECSLNALLALRVLSRSPLPQLSRPDFTGLRLPEGLVWILIPALALSWWPRPEVSTTALNVVLPLIFVYLLQGLAILLHLASRLRPSRFVLTLTVLVFLLQPYLLTLPLLLGLLDFRFDFRHRWQPPAPPVV